MEVHDWKVVDSQVEEFQRAVTTSDNELVLVDFGPGQIVERIIGVESVWFATMLVRCFGHT